MSYRTPQATPRASDRPGITEAHFFGTCDYSKEELIAEMGAAFLCGHCGIESTTARQFGRLPQRLVERLRADSHLIITAAAQAQRAADFILDRKADHTEPATDGRVTAPAPVARGRHRGLSPSRGRIFFGGGLSLRLHKGKRPRQARGPRPDPCRVESGGWCRECWYGGTEK